MPPSKGVWGIDIGQCALKAVRLELVEGRPTATAFDYVEHPKILSQPDADPDMLIREALEKFLSRNQIKHDEVAIGIPGQSGLARFVKLPPVEEKKIAEIVKFEAKQQIPFPLDEVIWDFQKIAGGEVVDNFAMETEIGLFALKRDVISRYLGYFTGAKIEVHTIQMSPLALVNYATYDTLRKGGTVPAPPEEDPDAEEIPRGKKRCVVVLDIGTEASNLIITDGGKIIWQRPIPLGGNNFTRALTKELKLTFAKAEHLKRNAAKSPELPQILKALKPVLQDFVGEVQRSLGYFTNSHRDAHVGYMVGLGSAFRLPGLQKYLAEKLSIDVRKPTEFVRLAGDAVVKDPLFVENLLTFPVAYGLGLQALGEARLSTNLLPGEIRTDRLIRAKKPYAAAAAAVLLLGTAGLALGYGSNYAALNDPGIAKAIDKAKAAGQAFDAQQSKFSQKQGEVEDFKAQVKQIVAGQDERLDWPRFEEVFTASLPKPGPATEGGNLPSAVWNVDGASAAIDWFNRRMRNGVPIEQALEDEQSEYPKSLAMVNVEAVHTRWVDNLGTFFQAVDNEVQGDPGPPKRGFGEAIARFMRDEDREPDGDKKDGPDQRMKPKIPEDWTKTPGGWVVEVRGYTDHVSGRAFIRDGLLKNLQRTDDFAKNPDKVPKYVPGVTDPVRGKVSHAFIYHVWEVEDPQPNAPRNIGQSYLDPLVAGRAAAPAGPGGAPPAAGPVSADGMNPAGGAGGTPAPGASGPAWTPLTAGAATGGGSPRLGGGDPGSSSPATGGAFPGQPPPPAPTKSLTPRRRYEFVVMFVWREPVGVVTPAGGEGPSSGGAPSTSTGMADPMMP